MGSAHASLKLIKTQLDGRYLLRGPGVCCMFSSPVHAPQGLCTHPPPQKAWRHTARLPPLAVQWIIQGNEEKRGRPRRLSFLSAGRVTPLASVNSWLKGEGC